MLEVTHVFSESKGHYDTQYPYDSPTGCESIEEHKPQGEGDKWYFDVKRGDRVLRLFDVQHANYKDVGL